MPYIIVRSWYPPSKMDEVVSGRVLSGKSFVEKGKFRTLHTISKSGFGRSAGMRENFARIILAKSNVWQPAKCAATCDHFASD